MNQKLNAIEADIETALEQIEDETWHMVADVERLLRPKDNPADHGLRTVDPAKVIDALAELRENRFGDLMKLEKWLASLTKKRAKLTSEPFETEIFNEETED